MPADTEREAGLWAQAPWSRPAPPASSTPARRVRRGVLGWLPSGCGNAGTTATVTWAFASSFSSLSQYVSYFTVLNSLQVLKEGTVSHAAERPIMTRLGTAPEKEQVGPGVTQQGPQKADRTRAWRVWPEELPWGSAETQRGA